MKRERLADLIQWKVSPHRKPLLVRGARQVGKTWLLQEFGRTAYPRCVYINFEDAPRLQSLFADDFDIDRILRIIQIEVKTKIVPEETLLIFDEIQSADRAITSLKYFCEKAPQIHLVAAGSLLGVALHKHHSFPVGKVDFLDLEPLSFREYLQAVGEGDLADRLDAFDWPVVTSFKARLIDHLRRYLFVGGMPEAVSVDVESGDLEAVRLVQRRLLNAYEADFSKYAPTALVPRIRMVWQGIPTQLAKESRKFIYGALRDGGRAKEFEQAIQWLLDCGLIVKCGRVEKPGMPLAAYQNLAAFKLFLVDVGLLSAQTGLDSRTLIDGNRIFEEFKGALTEQFVLQQLRHLQADFIGYWTNEKNTAEVDFLLQAEGLVIPIEVKAGESLQAKSFKFFCEKYRPEMAIRTSLSDYREEPWMTNLPLYAIGTIGALGRQWAQGKLHP
jgi:predicted AAA+ superfamily ATPase